MCVLGLSVGTWKVVNFVNTVVGAAVGVGLGFACGV